MMRATSTAKRCVLEFGSVHELVNNALTVDRAELRNLWGSNDADFFGGVSSLPHLAKVAKAGLSAAGIEAASIAEDRVRVMDRELPLPSFSTFYDVSGADVDVARYLSGEPECMISYTMVETPRVGRVITVVVSTFATWNIAADAIRERGRALVSLIFAIERIGFQVELWADCLIRGEDGTKQGRIRVKIKEPGGLLDSGQIMFALTHPGMVRGLCFTAMHLFPSEFRRALGVGRYYGMLVSEPDLEEYPDGSILIPPILSSDDPTRLVTDTLRKLGLVP